MPSRAERARRRALTRELARREREAAIAAMPLPMADLQALFDHLDEALADGCDHTTRLTRAFLRERSLAEAAVLPWLGSYGGYCDCEVLANVEDAWR